LSFIDEGSGRASAGFRNKTRGAIRLAQENVANNPALRALTEHVPYDDAPFDRPRRTGRNAEEPVTERIRVFQVGQSWVSSVLL
jgi:hypothetical protein